METRRIALSIVSPVYQAGETVGELVSQIIDAASKVTEDFEIVLIDDRSSDDSWIRIVQESRKSPIVRGARLSRNFGQHAAITAALSLARGDRVIVMDCDLQHDPKEIPRLCGKADEGYDIVLASHDTRRHALYRNLGAGAFRAITMWLSGRDQLECSVGTYSLLNRKVVSAFLMFTERHRHYHQILQATGFTVSKVEVEHRPRDRGRSSYTLAKLVRHAVHGMLGQSDRLLSAALFLGAFCCVGALMGICYVLFRWAVWGLLEGWGSLVVLILGATGLILFTLGVLGLYIGGIFEQVRARPIFLIDQTTDSDQDA
jgi:glycosyltransferase involved in cell wall biosynthesis